jgi:CrcB protein
MVLYVMVGGALGAGGRYLLGGWVLGWAGGAFPWGTLAINVLGSLVLGFVIGAAPLTSMTAEARTFLAVGLCGGFTTFSTYSFETIALLESDAWTQAGAYALGSVALGLVAILGGLAASRALLGAGS